MTQCRARRRLVQPSSSPGSHPQLGPLLQYSEGPASALPTPLLLVYVELQRLRLGSNPHRSPSPLTTLQAAQGARSSTAGEQSRIYFPVWSCYFLSLPGWIRCPQPTAELEHRGLQKPVAQTTHLQLQGSHPENISKVTWRQQHAQRIRQCGSSSPRSQRELFQKYGQSESLARLPTF